MLDFFDKYPYTDFHELNLDWLLKAVRDLAKEMHDWEIVNQISYQGIWDITKNYPKSSVVTDNNDGYISIQPVPVGINISNSDYWVKIANFSQELADLGNRVIALEAEVDKFIGLQNNSTRKVICISDSYGLTPTVDTSWIANIKNYLKISNSNFYRSQANGAGFIGLYPSYTFEAQLTAVASGISDADKLLIDDIIIVGGYNDAAVLQGGGTVNDMRNAIVSCLTYAHNTFPNAKIWLSCVAWHISDCSIHPYIRSMENLYSQSIAYSSRTAYIDGVYWMHREALADSTDFHPTAICAQCIAESLASAINGGSAFCDMAINAATGYISPSIDVPTTVSSATYTNVRQMYKAGTAYMTWQQIKFTPVANINPTGEVCIGEFTDGIIQGSDDFSTAVSMTCIALTNGATIKGNLLIHDNKLFFGNGEYQQLNAGNEITIIYGSGSGYIMI